MDLVIQQRGTITVILKNGYFTCDILYTTCTQTRHGDKIVVVAISSKNNPHSKEWLLIKYTFFYHTLFNFSLSLSPLFQFYPQMNKNDNHQWQLVRQSRSICTRSGRQMEDQNT